MISFSIPYHLPSSANLREDWRRRHVRVRAERQMATVAAQGFGVRPLAGPASVVVTITRVAPRLLDGDNAQAAAKALRDGLADALGLRDDSDPRVEWRVRQEKGKPAAVRVEVRPAGEGSAVTALDLRTMEGER